MKHIFAISAVFTLAAISLFFSAQSTTDSAATFRGGSFSPRPVFSTLDVASSTPTDGTVSTTTINLGQFGSGATTTSRTCFNVRSNTGATSSIYVVGTTLVVETSSCK